MSLPSERTRSRPADGVRDALLRALHRAGWRVAARVPVRVVKVLASVGARVAVRRPGRHVSLLRQNLSLATGTPASDALVRAGLRSSVRTFWEVLALPRWSREAVVARVVTVGEERLRAAHAGPGCVVALPHSGNWDLAGAWACSTGMAVTTVAEQLPDAEFEAYLAFRAGLGMEVLSHRDRSAIPALAAALRQGRLVCLVSDRDLDGSGVPVRWRGHRVTVPAGPAVVARRTGAVLLPAVCRYEDDRMLICFGEPVTPRPGREGLVAMMQEVADFFAEQIARAPQDWHMLQPFFPTDPDGDDGNLR